MITSICPIKTERLWPRRSSYLQDFSEYVSNCRRNKWITLVPKHGVYLINIKLNIQQNVNQKKSSSCKFTWSLFSLSDLLRPFFPNKSLLTKANPLPTLQTVAFFNRLFPPWKIFKEINTYPNDVSSVFPSCPNKG